VRRRPRTLFEFAIGEWLRLGEPQGAHVMDHIGLRPTAECQKTAGGVLGEYCCQP
jgi:hypothetical protein